MDPVGAAYQLLADRYVERFGHLDHVHPEDRSLVDRHLSVRGTVLDLGCGPGHLTAHLATTAGHAVGIDVVPRFVEHARSQHPDARFLLGSLRRLPVRDGAAAGVLAWYSLIHLAPAELVRVLTEMRRVTATGSPVVVGFFDGDRIEAFDPRVTAAYRWPADAMAEQLRGAGFAEIARQRRPHDDATGTRAHAALVALAR